MLEFYKVRMVIKKNSVIMYTSPGIDTFAHNANVLKSHFVISPKENKNILSVGKMFGKEVFYIEDEPCQDAMFSCQIEGDMTLNTSVEKIPFDGSDYQMMALGDEPTETVRYYMPNAVAIVTRSFKPTDCPWKQIGRRTFLWLVTLEDRNKDMGRRIPDMPKLFSSRKEALKWLYGNK